MISDSGSVPEKEHLLSLWDLTNPESLTLTHLTGKVYGPFTLNPQPSTLIPPRAQLQGMQWLLVVTSQPSTLQGYLAH